jgi:hypothetical protein
VCLFEFSQPDLIAQTSAPGRKYSFTFQNTPIESVIDTLRKSVEFGFSYNPDILPNSLKITRTFHNESLHFILDSLLIPNHLYYKQVGSNISIIRGKGDISVHKKLVKSNDSIRYIQLSGQITDSKNKQPISYAYVFLKSKPLGTLSNSEGYFIIKLPEDTWEDSIFFSCIGYQMEGLKIAKLDPAENAISLAPLLTQIKEVTVRPVNPEEILKTALENISKNYSPKPQFLTAFYRETIRQNRNYVVLSEAILQIYKAKYNGFATDQVKIFKGRKSPFVQKMDTIVFKFQGGIYTSLLLDIAKNPSTFIADDYFNLYNFKFDEITTIEGRSAYVIAFDQKDQLPFALYKGKIYIDVKTMAFVRADFMLSPKGIDNATSMLVRKSPPGVKVRPLTASYVVNYTFRNGVWYLNHIREEVRFKVRKRFNLYNITFHSAAEMVITQTDSLNIRRLSRSETVHPNDIFVEKIGPYDEEFWGEYNFIKPDESLEEALKRIKEVGKKM